MKKRLTSYTFDASEKTVLAAEFSDVTLEGIQLIVNVTDNIIIYNFADPTKGGTLATDTLTLAYDTTSMADADKLMILVEDGTTTQAVSGTITANIGTVATLATAAKQDTGNTSLSSIDGKITAVDTGAVVISSSALPSGAASLAEQQTQTGHLATIAGDTTDIEAAVELIDDTVATLGTTTYTEAATKGLIVGAIRRDADTTLVDTTNEVGPLQMNAAGQLKVEVFSGETLPVSLTSTTVTAITNALPAGTNAIGKLAANSGVDIGDVTLTAGTDAIGKLLPPNVDVTSNAVYTKKYYTNAGAVTDGIIWSPAAGTRWHIHTIYINVSAAATVTLEDDKAGGDEAIWKGEIAANSGVVMTFPEKYPWASGEDAADLIITTSAGNVYVTCSGYEV